MEVLIRAFTTVPEFASSEALKESGLTLQELHRYFAPAEIPSSHGSSRWPKATLASKACRPYG